MRTIVIILFLCFFSHSLFAQLSFNDVNNLINPLTTGLASSEPMVIGLMDSLQAKGDIYTGKNSDHYTKGYTTLNITNLCFENVTDTVRKEIVQVTAAIDQDNNVTYTTIVNTHDYNQYIKWISDISHKPEYILPRTKQTDLAHRIWTTYLPGTERRTWDFTAIMDINPKTQKHAFIYQLVYTRIYPYKILKPNK
jgi:hypothetical protein